MKKKISPYLIILLTFFIVIIIGSFLLMLPISLKSGVQISYIDALFTAASATCVTGLSTIDIASSLSVFGNVVLLVLIQFGGLGIVTVGIFFLSMLGIQFGVKERVLLKESLNQNNLSGLIKLVKTILIITVIIESFGAVINMICFIPEYGFWKGIGFSIFHSISSFNNAGFDPFVGESLIPYRNNSILLINTSLLIILGGLGFVVILDLVNFRKNHHFSVHTKIVVIMTFILLVSSTLLFKFTSYSELTWLDAFFQAVSVRTAGFNSVDLNSLSKATIVLMDFFMFIGCSPVSTGGGIKTTTLFVIIMSIAHLATGRQTIAFNRKISERSVLKAFWVSTIGVSFVILMVILISIVEPHLGLTPIVFESFSAFATVGLSLGITPTISVLSKIILCCGMFVGRLGPLTVASLFNSRWNSDSEGSIKYVEEKIIIG